ncbi:MAG: polysaccharide deacetylase family protein [Verrucomicrobiales bacterium]|nr:polysaccharide deacetylase family protein [Verrucomicrobiales bacterium]
MEEHPRSHTPRLNLNFLPLLAGIFTFLPLVSCNDAGSFAERVGEALNREPEANFDPITQPDPTQILAEEADSIMPPPPDPAEARMARIIDKDCRVSILGYHDFTEAPRPRNDMIINIEEFRSQMQQIKDAELPVISMRQFLDWKAGKEEIPEECVMITIDDGWKATHTLAMDVLKEFEYPFTVFLYKNYVGVGGRSLTHQEIRDLIANGGTIGSHSISHNNMAKKSGKSAEQYKEWLKAELEDSYNFLVENFGDTGGVTKTFAYPYGIYSDQIVEMAREFGYEACFTVNGRKTKWPVEKDEEGKDTKNPVQKWGNEAMEIGRYIVHGTTGANFGPALSFGGGSVNSSGRKLISETKTEDGEVQGPLVTTYPESGATIKNRLPRIEMDVSKLSGVNPDSISMRITGYGSVPHEYDPETGIISYQIPQRLRGDSCGVVVDLRHTGNNETEKIGWNFKINQLAEYLSSDNTKIEVVKKVAPPSEDSKGKPVARPTTAQN